MSGGWRTYDFFDAAESGRWEDRSVPAGGGATALLRDPTAVVIVADGVREVRIDEFTRAHNGGVQNLDNPKHLVVSAETFMIPQGGLAEFRVEMAAERIGGDDADYRDGFATFNVIDVDHKLVVDAMATGSRLHTIYELQAEPVGVVPRASSFLYVIDDPELDLDVHAGSWHDIVITIDRGRGRIEVVADGCPIFATSGLPVDPANIKLGMGILTLHPLDTDGRSRSCRGQGLIARWRDVRVRIEEPES